VTSRTNHREAIAAVMARILDRYEPKAKPTPLPPSNAKPPPSSHHDGPDIFGDQGDDREPGEEG